MTDKLILAEISPLSETLKKEVLHFVAFLKQEHAHKQIPVAGRKRVFGRSKGRYTLAPDFDAPLEDFKEYM